MRPRPASAPAPRAPGADRPAGGRPRWSGGRASRGPLVPRSDPAARPSPGPTGRSGGPAVPVVRWSGGPWFGGPVARWPGVRPAVLRPRWSARSAARPSGGPAVRQSGRPMVRRFGWSGVRPAVRQSGRPVFGGSAVRWSGPVLRPRPSGRPAVRCSGGSVVRQFGGPVTRPSGGAAVRPSDGPVVPVLRPGGPAVLWSGRPCGSAVRPSACPAVWSACPAVWSGRPADPAPVPGRETRRASVRRGAPDGRAGRGPVAAAQSAESAGSLVPARPVSTCPASRRR